MDTLDVSYIREHILDSGIVWYRVIVYRALTGYVNAAWVTQSMIWISNTPDWQRHVEKGEYPSVKG